MKLHLGTIIRLVRRFRKNPASDLCVDIGRARSHLSRVENGTAVLCQSDLPKVLKFLDQMHNREYFEFMWHAHISSVRVSLHDPKVPESLKTLVTLYAQGKYPKDERLEDIAKSCIPQVPEDIQEIINCHASGDL